MVNSGIWKFAAALVFVVNLTLASQGSAAYLIKLKNGTEFITARYWEVGKQVMFDTYGGAFGVDKSLVTAIERSDKPIRATLATQGLPNEKTQNDSNDKKEPAKLEASIQTKPEAKGDDDPITQEFNRLKERAKEVGGMLTSEIRELLEQITAFKTKIRSDRKLFINYAREFNEANEIANVTETALQSRSQ